MLVPIVPHHYGSDPDQRSAVIIITPSVSLLRHKIASPIRIFREHGLDSVYSANPMGFPLSTGSVSGSETPLIVLMRNADLT